MSDGVNDGSMASWEGAAEHDGTGASWGQESSAYDGADQKETVLEWSLSFSEVWAI